MAVAESVTAVPTVATAPLAGAVIAMLGCAAVTVTATAADVCVAPVESVTRAVREAEPVAVGVQEIVYGELTAVPI